MSRPVQVQYVRLVRIQRELLSTPRGFARFREYLRRMLTDDGNDVDLAPLVMMNPMAKEHAAVLLDELLALDADGVAERAVSEAAAELEHVPGTFKAGLVLADDAQGAWTNRYAAEYDLRFGPERLRERKGKRFWITGVLWTSERPSEERVREAMRTAVYRAAYQHEHGPVRTLGDMLAQEGWVLARAGCSGPRLEDDAIEPTRAVISRHVATADHAKVMPCLFGDEAAALLGYEPLGLAPWAGLALARHDAAQKGRACSPM